MRSLLLLALALSGCAAYPPAGSLIVPTADVAFEAPELYPEGVAYDAPTGTFLVSSLHDGTVGRVGADGTYRSFAAPGPLVSTQGIAIDATRGRVLVVGGDLGVGRRSSPATEQRQAGLVVYDMSGRLVRTVSFDTLTPGRRHANDLTLAGDGTAYVTDSFAGTVYRVSREGDASVFARDTKLFASENVGLNGVALFPEGFLIVAHSEQGALYRIPFSTPRRIERVALPEALVGADGIERIDPQTLAVVQNEGADRTVILRSTDGWRSASVVSSTPSRLPFPTTATRAGHDLYVLNAKLDELFDPDATRSSGFLLQLIPDPRP